VGRGLDTYTTFEHVEIRDVLRCEALDYRAADAVFFRGEFASEELLAPFSRNDGGVIRILKLRKHVHLL